MASNFPTSLDAFTNPTSADAMDSVSVPHATQHSDLNDAVEALEAKVGINSSAVVSSHDYKIAQLEAGATGGKILQVVSTTKTDVFSSTSTSFVTITGLSATITPSATSSNILVVANVKGTNLNGTGGASAMFRLARDGTAIAIGDADGSTTRATGSLSNRSVSPDIMMADTAVTLDSPATTSAVTYTVEGANPGSATTWYVNRNESLTNAAYNIRAVSSLTVLEVSA